MSGDVAHDLAVVDEEVDELGLGVRVDTAQAADGLRELEDRRRERPGGVDPDHVIGPPTHEEGALEAALVEPCRLAEGRNRPTHPETLREVHEQVGSPGVHLRGVLCGDHLAVRPLFHPARGPVLLRYPRPRCRTRTSTRAPRTRSATRCSRPSATPASLPSWAMPP